MTEPSQNRCKIKKSNELLNTPTWHGRCSASSRFGEVVVDGDFLGVWVRSGFACWDERL